MNGYLREDPDVLVRIDLENPSAVPSRHEDHEFEPYSAIWHPDGKSLIVYGVTHRFPNDGGRTWLMSVLRIVNAATSETQFEVRHPNMNWHQVAISADGRRFAAISNTNELLVWDFATRKLISAFYSTPMSSPISMNHDGTRLLARSPDNRILLWNVDKSSLIQSWPAGADTASTLTLVPDAKTIYLGGKDGGLRELAVIEPPVRAEEPEAPKPIENSLGMRLVPIAAGEFLMGTPDAQLPATNRQNYDDERPAHQVRITRPFYLAAHEVTVGQFRRFAEATGHRSTAETSGKGGEHLLTSKDYRADPKLNWRNPGFSQADDHPVVHVTWDDAQAFCAWLSKEEGQAYRLPTEAEWEYACRAGTTSRWSFGDRIDGTIRFGNVADAEVRKQYNGDYQVALHISDGYAFTVPVGSYLPNPFGLFDMHGNVWEWCQDRWDSVYYSYSPQDDPTGAKSGDKYCQRGGGCLNQASDSRSNNRDYGQHTQATSTLGFRILRVIPVSK